jgi:RNA polymerase sigma-70 factor (ECF subfamily)
MKRASARHETYVGTWLPEPLVSEPGAPRVDDLSFALLMALERLSPLERAAFLLHDVFDMDYVEIGSLLERSEAACRQLTARAREHVRAERPRFPPSDEVRDKLVDAFMVALTAGDIGALANVLAEEAVLYSDGGGKRPAALEPIRGRDAISAFFARIAGASTFAKDARERVDINGLPGFVLHPSDGPQTIAFEIARDRIDAIYVVRNPDKLRHLS